MSKQNGTIRRDIKQEHSLLAWREANGNITLICKKIGINRKTFYEWLKDPEFSNLIKLEEEKLNDDIRSKLIELALNGNMRAITYYLDHKHPEFINRGQTLFISNPQPILGGDSIQEPINIDFVKTEGSI